MLTDYFSWYKFNTTSIHFHEEKNSPEVNDCQKCIPIKVWGYSFIDIFIKFQWKERYIF